MEQARYATGNRRNQGRSRALHRKFSYRQYRRLFRRLMSCPVTSFPLATAREGGACQGKERELAALSAR